MKTSPKVGTLTTTAAAPSSAPVRTTAPQVVTPKPTVLRVEDGLDEARRVGETQVKDALVDALNAPVLSFQVVEGPNLNQFIQSEKIASQLVVSSDPKPRAISSFPSGNSGIALFGRSSSERPLSWDVGPLRHLPTERGQRVAFTLYPNQMRLVLQRPVLDSLRSHREVTEGTGHPLELTQAQQRIQPQPEITHGAQGTIVTFVRKNLDESKYELVLRLPTGSKAHFLDNGDLSLQFPAPAESVAARGSLSAFPLEVEAEIPFAPLTPFEVPELFRKQALQRLKSLDPSEERTLQIIRSLQSLRFLAYQQGAAPGEDLIPFNEKFLAGGWRFLTYFGRDVQLMALMAEKYLLTPQALEAALASVLDRVSPEGRVAHEEDVGTFAEYRALQEGLTPEEAAKQTPIFDYKMVDDDFMLPLLMQAYQRQVDEHQVSAFLASQTPQGPSRGAALMRNFDYVLKRAAQYTGDAKTLIRIDDPYVGDWRDSEAGLGGGVFPASVNVDLVANSLRAISKVSKARGDDARAEATEPLRKRWEGANAHFAVHLTADDMRSRLRTFLDLDSNASQRDRLRDLVIGRNAADEPVTLNAFLQGTTPVNLAQGLTYDALSLDADGNPIPVMHSDSALRLYLGDPPIGDVEQMLKVMELPYPVGLMTPAGVLTANPAYAHDFSFRGLDTSRQHMEETRLTEKLDRRGYHGTVVWLWPHSMMQLGLMRQIERFSTDPELRDSAQAQALVGRMLKVLDQLRAATDRMGELANAELITFDDEGQPTSFGQAMGSDTESNAAQLWSTVLPAVELAYLHLKENLALGFAQDARPTE
jgi:hypothetical protein